MSKLHKTALGKPIDMASLRAKNEKVRAVGNMNVNARGDIIDSNNRVINDANKRVNVMYEKTMQNPKASQRVAPPPVTRRHDQNNTVETTVETAAAPAVATATPAISQDMESEVYTGAPEDFDDDTPNPDKTQQN